MIFYFFMQCSIHPFLPLVYRSPFPSATFPGYRSLCGNSWTRTWVAPAA
jgi:hypothetical protein